MFPIEVVPRMRAVAALLSSPDDWWSNALLVPKKLIALACSCEDDLLLFSGEVDPSDTVGKTMLAPRSCDVLVRVRDGVGKALRVSHAFANASMHGRE